MLRYAFFIIVLACLATKCQNAVDRLPPTPTPFAELSPEWADSILRTMTLEQKIGQLVIMESDLPSPKVESNIQRWITKGQIGGLWLSGLPLPEFMRAADTCRRLAPLPLLLASNEKVLLNNQFSELPPIPRTYALYAAESDTMFLYFNNLYPRQLKALGINCAIAPSLATSENLPSTPLIERLNEQHTLSIADRWSLRDWNAMRDTSAASLATLSAYQEAIHAGVSGFWIDDQLLKYDSLNRMPFFFLKDAFSKRLNFRGLLMARVRTEDDIASWIRAGIDLYVVDRAPERVVRAFQQLLKQKLINTNAIDQKVRQVLLAKAWLNDEAPPLPPAGTFLHYANQGCLPPEQEMILSHFEDPQWAAVGRALYEKSATLLNNHLNVLPFKELRNQDIRVVSRCRRPLTTFFSQLNKYTDYRPQNDFTYGSDEEEFCETLTFIVALDRLRVGNVADSAFVRQMLTAAKRSNVVLLNFGSPALLRTIDTSLSIVQLYELNQMTEATAVQVMVGALAPKGKLPITVSSQFPAGAGKGLEAVRLKFTQPEDASISASRLSAIDRIVSAAISDGATPGCQVVVAKSGNLIYSKGFGRQTYKKGEVVTTSDIYDIASVSKVAATTLAAMKLYEQGRFRLSERIEDHLPCDKSSTIRRIAIRNLMIHQSGLQPHMPVVPYIAYREKENADCKVYFCKDQTDTFAIQVADRFFFNRKYERQIWKDIHKLPVDRRSTYRYSDANFVLVQKILETKMNNMSIDNWMEENFYRPMGLRNITFRPLSRFELARIVPTENDQSWRQQQVHGYVHDPTAALLGGIAGNAGVFTNAEDLATLFQMLLNGGTYGGERYLREETVALFTSNKHGNHRGLGFDKPSEKYQSAHAAQASSATFGHTGFTGTCVWADPKSELVFVFLSNRLYPDASNWKLFSNKIRERIHETIYRSFNSYHFYIPELADWTAPLST